MRLQWQDDLATATEALLAQRESLRGLVLASARAPLLRADLRGVMRLREHDAADRQVQRMTPVPYARDPGGELPQRHQTAALEVALHRLPLASASWLFTKSRWA